MCREFSETHVKRYMRVLERLFGSMKVSLCSRDPMEQMDKFMGDGIFPKEGNLFDSVEDNGCFEDGGVE